MIMEILSIFLVGIGLSMDTFSLSMCYGTLNLSNHKINILSIIVGIFHFMMPLLGMTIGHLIGHYVVFDARYIIFIIFMILGLEMISNVLEKKTSKVLLSAWGFIVFGFTVSIDSFSAGIGLEFISDKHFLCAFIFSITSAVFTYIGLKLGTKLNNRFKDSSQIAGALILILFALTYLFK
jgi:putative Mn2+ efflux pump MntP